MLLTVSGIKKEYAGEPILKGVTFKIDRYERVALIGRNGCGKSTLLKILVDELQPDAGSKQLARGARISYLKQDSQVNPNKTVLEEGQEGLRHLFAIKERLAILETEIERESTDELLEEYAMLHEHFEESDGYSLNRDVQTVLKKLGFAESQFNLSTAALSGGQRTRLALAKLLLEEPELLLLDEPTNHLDLDATEFLENWLRNYHGSAFIVSHDRRFLEAVATRVMEMQDGQVKSYPGDYKQYLRLRQEDEDRQKVVAAKQQIQIDKLDEYVRRFMNSQRTAQARGRLKQMNRLVETKVEAPKAERGLKAAIESSKRSGQDVVVVQKADIGYPEKVLIKGLTWTVRYQERWGVMGENGTGKSTLAKTLMSKLEPLNGIVRIGAGVSIGYFSQDAENFNYEQSPLDFMVWECDLSPIDARHLLGRFLIEGDDVFRPIRSLSGGERNKLALAHLSVLKPNLLILDEPTNHLDMASREALAEILKEYSGTLILISHDRWLLGEIADHILDIKQSESVQYPGTFNEYRTATLTGKNVADKKGPKPSNIKQNVPEEIELSPREVSKEINRLEQLIKKIEVDIEELELDIKEIEGQLAHLNASDDVLQLTREHTHKKDLMESFMASWEEVHLQLDSLKSKQGKTVATI